MAQNGGPWGGGGGRGPTGGNGGGDGGDRRPPGQPPRPPQRRPGGGQQMPEIDQIVSKGREQLRVLMGGRGGAGGPGGPRGGGDGLPINRVTVGFGLFLIFGLWLWMSFYRVDTSEQSVELFLGDFSGIGEPGLNFAPWPFVTAEVIQTSVERTESIGVGRGSDGEDGLMLTTDENIVDIDFQVVWVISNPAEFLFNLADPEDTIRAVSEAAMREIIAQSQLAPILNRDRAAIGQLAEELIQATLDSYESGVDVVRVNLNKADPPAEVIDSFRAVQAAEQQRDTLERQADAYANRVVAGARGEAAQTLEEAEGYRAQVVNEASGEASRFSAVLAEYEKAPEVTRKRLYLETMENVLGRVDKIILDDTAGGAGGQGVVPYLPLNELGRSRTATGGTN